MKHVFLLILISLSLCADPIILHTKAAHVSEKNSQPHTPAPAKGDDDTDGAVVLANVAAMLGCIGMLSTDPYNPAVAGPSLAKIGISFINIITQIFKSHGIEEEITRACIKDWFRELSDGQKAELMNVFIEYADHLRSQEYCPNCECEWCTSYRLVECRDCR